LAGTGASVTRYAVRVTMRSGRGATILKKIPVCPSVYVPVFEYVARLAAAMRDAAPSRMSFWTESTASLQSVR